MLFDYLENIMISLMITKGADVSSGIIIASNIFTLMKGIFTTLSWVVILILLVLWLFNAWKNKAHTAKDI